MTAQESSVELLSKGILQDWERACCCFYWACQLFFFLAPDFPPKKAWIMDRATGYMGFWDVVRALKKTWMTNVLAWPVPLCFKWEIGKWLSEDDHCVLWLKPAQAGTQLQSSGQCEVEGSEPGHAIEKDSTASASLNRCKSMWKKFSFKEKVQIKKTLALLNSSFPELLTLWNVHIWTLINPHRVCNPSQSRLPE